MSLRRPSLKSTLYMTLMALGIAFVGQLIFRGAGAPRDPARVVVPADRAIHLDAPGRYVILTEQVAEPRATRQSERRIPEITIEIRDPVGSAMPLDAPELQGWLFKFLTRQRGHTIGAFEAPVAGDYQVKADLLALAGRKPDCAVIVAFSPLASPVRFFWLVIGFGGQIFFSLRFLVQWLASEKARRSTIPRSFWYFSIFGGLMTLAYAIHTRDPVFIAAYAFNAFIYLRNLILLRREDLATGDPLAPSAGPSTT